MKLRNRLSLNYTTAFIVLLSITLTAIFFSVRTNRKNEFHQHFSEKTLSAFHKLKETGIQTDEAKHSLFYCADFMPGCADQTRMCYADRSEFLQAGIVINAFTNACFKVDLLNGHRYTIVRNLTANHQRTYCHRFCF